ncbi:twin-arginine translocation signal domain-containing protein, partial [Streptomyces sp. NPDC006372]|uniref:twin-arginine translocation signal domain-containing protein n=1 Tax=Streptomyces sp. NPDC006372 TaxID=3155599 RepID=UPI0033B68574
MSTRRRPSRDSSTPARAPAACADLTRPSRTGRGGPHRIPAPGCARPGPSPPAPSAPRRSSRMLAQPHRSSLSRRGFLVTGAAAGAALGLPSGPARAATRPGPFGRFGSPAGRPTPFDHRNFTSEARFHHRDCSHSQ